MRTKRMTRAVVLALFMASGLGMRAVKADSGGPGGPSVSSCAFVLGISFHMPDLIASAFLALWNGAIGPCSF